jgi:hypothetical protein
MNRRYGEPNMTTFPFWAETVDHTHDAIVYAPTMMQAVNIYRQQVGRDPYSIRQMSDNE